MKLKLFTIVFSFIAVMSFVFAGTYTQSYCTPMEKVTEMNSVSSKFKTGNPTTEFVGSRQVTFGCKEETSQIHASCFRMGYNCLNCQVTEIKTNAGQITEYSGMRDDISNENIRELNLNYNNGFRDDYKSNSCYCY